MLKTNSKLYRVYEYGGEWDDQWESTVGICSSFKLAEELKTAALAAREVKCNISEKEFRDMLEFLYRYEDEHEDFEDSCEEEDLKKLFPNKNPKDIELACKRYFTYPDFTNVSIEEVDFYND